MEDYIGTRTFNVTILAACRFHASRCLCGQCPPLLHSCDTACKPLAILESRCLCGQGPPNLHSCDTACKPLAILESRCLSGQCPPNLHSCDTACKPIAQLASWCLCDQCPPLLHNCDTACTPTAKRGPSLAESDRSLTALRKERLSVAADGLCLG